MPPPTNQCENENCSHHFLDDYSSFIAPTLAFRPQIISSLLVILQQHELAGGLLL